MNPANGGRRVRGQGSGLRSCHRRRQAADCCARGTGAGRAGAGRGQGADRAQAGPRAGPHLKPSPSCRPVDRALHRAPAPTREVRLLSRRATRFVPTGWSAVRFRLPGSAVVRWRCCRLVMSDRGMPVRQGSAYERDASLVASSRSMEVPSCFRKAQPAVGAASHWVGIMVVLPVVLPEATGRISKVPRSLSVRKLQQGQGCGPPSALP